MKVKYVNNMKNMNIKCSSQNLKFKNGEWNHPLMTAVNGLIPWLSGNLRNICSEQYDGADPQNLATKDYFKKIMFEQVKSSKSQSARYLLWVPISNNIN